MFVDEVEIFVQGGRGGNGCLSFRREKYVPKGGPDGGDGGDGGSIILVADDSVDSLAHLTRRKRWIAENGERGGSALCHGRSGKDLVIPVPPGTLVFDADHDLLIKDLREPGDRVIAARGGKGGKGNAAFKSPTNRTPREWMPGGEGETRQLRLELRLIADVGLLGKPNAGKSTLLSRLTRARPKTASYPFTTKHPQLGRVLLDMERSFVIADIPGLIEGAHHGAGLGHEFLRHIQRSGILLHLIEPEPYDGSDPVANYFGIRRELEQFDSSLMTRPEIVAVTKADLPTATTVQARLEEAIAKPVLLISAVTGQNLHVLTGTLWNTLQEFRQASERQVGDAI